MGNFHNTSIGKLFYGKHIPELVKELRRIADSLEKGNKLYENELRSRKRKEKSFREKKDEIKETNRLIDNSDDINYVEDLDSDLDI